MAWINSYSYQAQNLSTSSRLPQQLHDVFAGHIRLDRRYLGKWIPLTDWFPGPQWKTTLQYLIDRGFANTVVRIWLTPQGMGKSHLATKYASVWDPATGTYKQVPTDEVYTDTIGHLIQL